LLSQSQLNGTSRVVLSIVVPVKDEQGNVAALAREIAAATADEVAEIIFVDDGSTDGTAEELRKLKGQIPNFRVIGHNGNFGQSRAVRTGVRAARGDLVVTLDGDGQNDPADIPELLSILRADNTGKLGLVGGVRVKRQDASNRRFASNFANAFRRRMLKDGASDSGCGLKAFRREAYLALPYFDHMHRFLIALMLREGYQVREVPVNHRARAHGASKYNNLHRALVGIVDIVGVRWLQKRFRGAVEPEEM
jgi:dolichol-phosphate mannosyltransferase